MTDTKFEDKLREAGVPQAAERLGLDFEGIFLEQVVGDNPYLDYDWQIVSNSKEGLKEGIVIHGVPSPEKFGELPWEEWFVLGGEQHHHILYTEECEHCDQEIYIDNSDRGHPEQTRESRWFYYNDTDLTPKLFQTQ